ncbi:two-component system response regulator [Desulfonema ishimotonii]|uniref:Two-component system response regulator n=1 Tax=Desulfonema ishimotonii TaxID=45657 RepID=A0A401FSD2_9BACT|nr:HD domain-containing phosphohydrolase [Desulfonema ishimotonii]GBC59874.1 two-component system response regulator [Desulfonema ishimotonii]
MNILIVEDDAITRRRLEKFLRAWGHRVTAASNGLEASEYLHSDSPDLVITDWMMPEMDGPALIRKIRHSSAPYVYIILLTARGGKGDMIRGLFNIGADDYVVKPFDPDELRARLSVGERTIRLERNLREYSKGLEAVVRRQTQLIRETQEETIVKLLTALESRDHETGGHVRRISLFSTLIAKATGWSDTRLDDLRLASPMHDIGKIGVPDRILRKPGRLTPSEFEIIKTHAAIGGRILGNSELPMLKMAREIALCHHEKWDGTGYPGALSGENIPETARIVAIADVFDALSNDRVYRRASPESEVLDIMEQGRGSHFDPHLCDRFMGLLDRFRKVLAENP